MNDKQIVRAWKDEEYRASLTEAERDSLPGHPAGPVELPESLIGEAGGAEDDGTWDGGTFGCCGRTFYVGGCGTYRLLSFGCCAAELL